MECLDLPTAFTGEASGVGAEGAVVMWPRPVVPGAGFHRMVAGWLGLAGGRFPGRQQRILAGTGSRHDSPTRNRRFERSGGVPRGDPEGVRRRIEELSRRPPRYRRCDKSLVPWRKATSGGAISVFAADSGA